MHGQHTPTVVGDLGFLPTVQRIASASPVDHQVHETRIDATPPITETIQGMDPRAARTRLALHRAILALAAERPIGEIPVTEIVVRAGVNRSSLYQHFDDREELLASALESIESEHTRIDRPVTVTGLSEPPPELRRFVEHFSNYAPVYRLALGPHGSARVASRVRARITTLVREGITLSTPSAHSSLPLEVEAAGTAGALLGIIEEWIHRDPMPNSETATTWLWDFLAPPESRSRAGLPETGRPQ